MKNGHPLVVFAILLSLFASSCENDLPLSPYGRIEVRCSLIYKNDSKSIDAYQLDLAKVRLMQDRHIVMEVNLDIDKPAKTGRYVFSNLQSGTYDVLVLIGVTNEKFDYVSTSSMTIAHADHGIKQMPRFDDYLGTLHYTNAFDATTPDIEDGTVTLFEYKTGVEVISDIIEPMPARSLAGSFVDRYPDEYTLGATLFMRFNGVLFEAFNSVQSVDIAYGRENWVNISGIQSKVGRLILDCANGDRTPPKIIDGPFITYDYKCETHVTSAVITWTTDKPATTNVCYSSKEDFSYRDEVFWSPSTYDYVADSTQHEVRIPGFSNDPNNPVFFVVVTSDREADMFVSGEIRIPVLTAACADAILAFRLTFNNDIRKIYIDGDIRWSTASNLEIILNWSNIDKAGFLEVLAEVKCGDGNSN